MFTPCVVAGFSASETKYLLNVYNFDASADQYSNMMDVFEEKLIALGQAALMRNFVENLLFWSSWVTAAVIPGTTTGGIFQMSGDPFFIMDNLVS